MCCIFVKFPIPGHGPYYAEKYFAFTKTLTRFFFCENDDLSNKRILVHMLKVVSFLIK